MCDLMTTFDYLKHEVLCRDHDVSFAGDNLDVIMHALSMLGNHLVTVEPSIDISLL
jgi:hypothetical protein